jgi:hypothetical protein
MKMFGILQDRAVFTDYLERCQARPAYARAMAREDELAE